MDDFPDPHLREFLQLRADDPIRAMRDERPPGHAGRGGSAVEHWIAPTMLDRLGDARPAVDALLLEIETRGASRRADGLGWGWPGWVEVALDPWGHGIEVRYGGDLEADPDAPVLRPLSAPSHSLERVIADWIDAHRRTRPGGPIDARTRQRRVRALGRLLARHPAVRASERAGAAILAIPPAVLRLAREIERCQPHAPHRHLRARSLDLAWRHFAALARAREENPALFPLLGAFVAEHGLRPDVDPVCQLREACRFRGLSQAEWARIARDGTGDFDWALRLVGDRVSHLELVIGMTRFERALGASLADVDPDLRIRWLSDAEPWRCQPEIEHAARLYRRSEAPPAEGASIMGLLNQGLDAGLVSSAEVLAMPGWRALETRVVAAVQQRERGAGNGELGMLALHGVDRIEQQLTTAAWLRSLDVPDHAMVARRLVTTAALTAEGHEMHHCVGSYARRVERGSYLVYTIRGPDGRPVATAGFRRKRTRAAPDAPWELDDLRGMADRAAPPSVRPLVAALLETCNGTGGPPEHLAATPTIESTDEQPDEDGSAR